MHPELLDLYNRELSLLYEQAQEFAEAYPGVARRLGDLTRDRMDPMLIGLLEGTALLAARVQLKLKHEFPEFTQNLIEHLYPNFLAPLPSVFMPSVTPKFGDPALRDGRKIKKGATLDSIYKMGRSAGVSCQFTLCSDITLWPFEIAAVEYHLSAASLRGTKAEFGQDIAAGLQISLLMRNASELKDEPSDEVARKDPLLHFSNCATRELNVHLIGAEAEAIGLYEQIFAHLRKLTIRYLDEFGDPVFVDVPTDAIEQVGFDDGDHLLPYDDRLFRGFAWLQEYFLFPRKFLGFRLKGIDRYLKRVRSNKLDLIFMFDNVNPRLRSAAIPAMFSLYSTPAINLFRKTSDLIEIDTDKHEYHVIPDRSEPINFEAHRPLGVFLHYPGRAERKPVPPLYLATIDQAAPDASRQMYYALRRVPRRRSEAEMSRSAPGDYVGTEMYISITSPNNDEDAGRLQLSVSLLCSNRHLAGIMPVGEHEREFRFREDSDVYAAAAVAPTMPRESPLALKKDVLQDMGMGPTAWRLINVLSLNHFGVSDPDAGALKEVLGLFADLGDPAIVRRIQGIRSVDSRPVTRRLQQRLGVGVARGIEVTVTLEDKAFEGSGVYLLGAVLDRFFAEYASVNHFTTTVVRTVERGVIMRWPPRSGSRSVL